MTLKRTERSDTKAYVKGLRHGSPAQGQKTDVLIREKITIEEHYSTSYVICFYLMCVTIKTRLDNMLLSVRKRLRLAPAHELRLKRNRGKYIPHREARSVSLQRCTDSSSVDASNANEFKKLEKKEKGTTGSGP